MSIRSLRSDASVLLRELLAESESLPRTVGSRLEDLLSDAVNMGYESSLEASKRSPNSEVWQYHTQAVSEMIEEMIGGMSVDPQSGKVSIANVFKTTKSGKALRAASKGKGKALDDIHAYVVKGLDSVVSLNRAMSDRLVIEAAKSHDFYAV